MRYTHEHDLLIIEECKTSKSMYKSSQKLGMNYKTFISRAKKLGCYNPNASGRGTSKVGVIIFKTGDILAGKHPNYHTCKLRVRLLKDKIKNHICEICNNTTWLDKPIPLELHHINGIKNDHTIENLQLLCPNCHSQTSNYGSKNKKKLIIENWQSGNAAVC